MSADLWPRFDSPQDLPAIEAVPLEQRGLPQSTYAALARAATQWPDKVALTMLPDAARWDLHRTYTFAQLHRDVTQVANLLHGRGVRRTDAVAIVGLNSYEQIVATLAAQACGIVAPINPGLAPQHIGSLLERTGAKVLVAAGPEFGEQLWSGVTALAAASAVEDLLVVRPVGATGPAPDLPTLPGVGVGYLLEQAAYQRSDELAPTPPTGDDLASFFHTGGTTGAPKLAAHTHANEVSDAWMIANNTVLDPDSVIFAALPLFHVNALVVTVLAPLLRGQHVVWGGPLGYRDQALIGGFWRLVEEFGITAMSAVPTVYAALSRVPVDADHSSLRFALVGASPLPAAVRTAFESATGIRLVEGYGLTEATCASFRDFPDHHRPGALGFRLPYQQVRVLDPTTVDGTWRDAEPGSVGVLAIGGPTVFPGYVVSRNDEGPVLDSLGTVQDGWLATGDLARLDTDGALYLTGRAKDVIIRGGHNIDPAAIESALLRHPAVVAVAAVGRPDERAGEVPVAYVVADPSTTTPSADELLAWVADVDQGLEAAAQPKAVYFVDALPTTDVGKVFKPALRVEAARRVVVDVLDRAGVDAAVDVATGASGPEVVVRGRAEVSDAVEAALMPYTLPWRWELAP
jgi:fatty-acyl-CoA synthase